VMMTLPKLSVTILTSSRSRFISMPQARFLAVSLRHAIVQTKATSTVKNKRACRQASTNIQVLHCKLLVSLAMSDYNSQEQACMSSSFYKHLSLTVQATRKPCDIRVYSIYNVGKCKTHITNRALSSIKVHDHPSIKALIQER
jgi:hypothetical protein